MLRYWDMRDWREVWRHDLDTGPIFGVALSEDGRSAVTSNWDHQLGAGGLPAEATEGAAGGGALGAEPGYAADVATCRAFF
jgi:hypothetical protein